MTKAKTKAARRRGRPCKNAARTKSGRISYAREPQEAPDVLARSKRVELYGGTMEGAGDQQRGTVIGRLKISGEISEHQHGALQRYGELAERYFASIHAPDSLKSKTGGSAMRIANDDADIQTAKNWRGATKAINEAQTYHPGNLMASLQYVVVRDEFHEHMIGDVRIAANALVRYYGLS